MMIPDPARLCARAYAAQDDAEINGAHLLGVRVPPETAEPSVFEKEYTS